MPYTDAPDDKIISDINNERVPDDALVSKKEWRQICVVRGRNFSQVDPEAWVEVCTKRGYLRQRQNSRGF